MMQVIDGKTVYVVEFDTMPELPIIGMTENEAQQAWYRKFVEKVTGRLYLLPHHGTGNYARALTDAIETGVITEPGKYGIHINFTTKTRWNYNIFKIIE